MRLGDVRLDVADAAGIQVLEGEAGIELVRAEGDLEAVGFHVLGAGGGVVALFGELAAIGQQLNRREFLRVVGCGHSADGSAGRHERRGIAARPRGRGAGGRHGAGAIGAAMPSRAERS